MKGNDIKTYSNGIENVIENKIQKPQSENKDKANDKFEDFITKFKANNEDKELKTGLNHIGKEDIHLESMLNILMKDEDSKKRGLEEINTLIAFIDSLKRQDECLKKGDLEIVNTLNTFINSLKSLDINKENKVCLSQNLEETIDKNLSRFLSEPNNEDKINNLLNMLKGLRTLNNSVNSLDSTKNKSQINLLLDTKFISEDFKKSNYKINEILNSIAKDSMPLINKSSKDDFYSIQNSIDYLIGKLENYKTSFKKTSNKNSLVNTKFNLLNFKNSEENKIKNDNEIKDFVQYDFKNKSKIVKNSSTDDIKFISKEDSILDKIAKGAENKKVDSKFTLFNVNSGINKPNEALVEFETKINLTNKNSCEDVIKTIKFMCKEGIKELTVKVNPKELGEITIKLIMDASGIKAQLSTSSKEAYNILNSNLNELRSVIQSENIKIGDFSLQLSKEDPSFYSNNSNQSSFNEEFSKNKESNNRKFNANDSELIDENFIEQELNENERNNIINIFA